MATVVTTQQVSFAQFVASIENGSRNYKVCAFLASRFDVDVNKVHLHGTTHYTVKGVRDAKQPFHPARHAQIINYLQGK